MWDERDLSVGWQEEVDRMGGESSRVEDDSTKWQWMMLLLLLLLPMMMMMTKDGRLGGQVRFNVQSEFELS